MKINDDTLSILVGNLSLKDYVEVTKSISELEIEIDRLNNIITELKKINYKIQEDSCHQAIAENDFASGMYKASEMNLSILNGDKNEN